LSPQLAKHAHLGPFLEVVVQRAAGIELTGSRFPLATGSQHIENAIRNLTQGQARVAAKMVSRRDFRKPHIAAAVSHRSNYVSNTADRRGVIKMGMKRPYSHIY
jgi:hypothetical protein